MKTIIALWLTLTILAHVSIASATEPLSVAVTYIQAVETAINNNLKTKIKQQEKVVQEEFQKKTMMKMLPSLQLKSEYSRKNHHTPTYSEDYFTGEESLSLSVSNDLDLWKHSVDLSWDLLNLATDVYDYQRSGYQVQGRQQSILRTEQNLIFDVTRTFFHALALREATIFAENQIAKMSNRQKVIEKQIANHQVDEVTGLKNQARLLQTTIQFKRYKQEYISQIERLKELMGLESNYEIELVDYDFFSLPGLKIPSLPQRELDIIALQQRPDIVELKLDELISDTEATSALISQLPHFTPYINYDYSSNSYMSVNDWVTIGFKVSWDLFDAPEKYFSHVAAKEKAYVDTLKRATLAQAILTQLRIAISDFSELESKLQLSHRLFQTRKEISDGVNQQYTIGRSNEDEVLYEEKEYIISYIEYLMIYSQYVASWARVYNTLGYQWVEGEYLLTKNENKDDTLSLLNALNLDHM